MQSIIVRHNVEMAHRLSQQPDSKCYQLHGHSWWVEVEIIGSVNLEGMILDFASLKRRVREYLDANFDHRLVLHSDDSLGEYRLPGAVYIPYDPTVENMARHWGQYLHKVIGVGYKMRVKVWEASTNAATWRSYE